MRIAMLFRGLTATDVMHRQRAEAQLLRVEHQAAAEHHHALAAMYLQREQRLRGEIEAIDKTRAAK